MPTLHSYDNGALAGSGEEIVISGLSGKFPESDSIEEFKQNLYAGVDMVTDDGRRWTPGLHGLPIRSGKLKDLKHFDASFFGVHSKQAEVMDPALRIMHELAYETIVDAGYNPIELRGRNIGVVVAVSTNESVDYWSLVPDKITGYGMLGCLRGMFANRISYSFDLIGPSYTVDSSCSSSMLALHQGYEVVRSGQAEACIVGGVNLTLKPTFSLELHRVNLLCPDGACKSFDVAGDGYVRSEAINTVFLQKAKDARRIYATILHAGSNCDGYKEEGVTYPSGPMQRELFERVFKEAKINPLDVTYVEAHGPGTKVGDPEECDSIVSFFCDAPKRKEPLIIGSVKSNMGHSESSSGLCSLAKVLISMEAGVIPGNIHFNEPRNDIPSLMDGRLKVIDKNTPWSGGLAVINSFGFGGANGHVILRPNPKQAAPAKPMGRGGIPRLVVVSGRTEEAVNAIFDQIDRVPEDEGFLALLDETYKYNVDGHIFRGYTLLGGKDAPREIAENNGEKRPVWFIFSGLGSQWPGMAKALYQLEVFRNSLNKCAAALKPHGVDLIDIVINGTAEALEHCTNSFISITATQIALADTLASFGIKPDHFIGHSLGEIGCAYADDTMTAEQAVLAAYWRGRAFEESGIAHYRMAAIGLSWEETKKRVPADVFPACHNSADSVTVSGTKEGIAKFTAQLQAEGIFAKEVRSAGIGAHCKYVADSVPLLKKYYDQLLPNPKPRSSRWISSSVPEAQWNEPIAKLSSTEYHINNVTRPVLFAEALKKVPENAIVIELAPDWLFGSIIRRSLGPNVTSIGLSKRNNPDNLSFFLSSIGKLYSAGLQINMSTLVNPVQFPVPRGTQQIASLVKWDHTQEWAVPDFNEGGRSGDTVVEIDLNNERNAFLAGSIVNLRNIFPAAGYINLVWRAFAKLHGSSAEELAVTLENVQFHRDTILQKEKPVELVVNVFDGTGKFEVSESGSAVVSGRISVLQDPEHSFINLPAPKSLSEDGVPGLKLDDIYKEMRVRGYDYTGAFCGVAASNISGTAGKIQWTDEWTSFMDNMFQFFYFGQPDRKIFLPNVIERINLDPARHKAAVNHLAEGAAGIDVVVDRDVNIMQAGGVEVHGLRTNLVPRILAANQMAPKHERYTCVPLNYQTASGKGDMDRVDAINSLLLLAAENSSGALKIKAVEIEGPRGLNALLAPVALQVFALELYFVLDVTCSSNEPLPEPLADLGIKQISAKKSGPFDSPAGTNLVMATDLSKHADPAIWTRISESLKVGGFVLDEEVDSAELRVPQGLDLTVVSKLKAGKFSYTLLRKVEPVTSYHVIKVHNTDFSWIEPLKASLKDVKEKGERILLVAQGEPFNGIIGLTASLRKEPGGINVRSFLILDPKAPAFSTSAPVYAKQLQLDLVCSVLTNADRNDWGTYRYTSLGLTRNVASRQVENAYVDFLTHGDLSSLRWFEGPPSAYRPKSYPGKEICQVHYAAVQSCDAGLASGKLAPADSPRYLNGQNCVLGREFSGHDSRGRRVMGSIEAGGLATSVLADPKFLWEVPTSWTLEQAATVPGAHTIAYYALVLRGRMAKGESLLIYNGAKAIGQAAISIALHAGCTVYATVSSQEQRNILKQRFPELPQNHIVNPSESTFEQSILQATKGRGVNLMLHVPSEGRLKVSARCLAKHGRFLDLSRDAPEDMTASVHTYQRISDDDLYELTDSEKLEVARLVSDGIKTGAVRPLASKVFDKHSLEEAFTYRCDRQKIELVLIEIRKDEKSASSLVNAIPRSYMDPAKSYLVVGGMGGFGLELSGWLLQRGVTKLVINSRNGVKNGYQALCVRRWNRLPGVKVIISKTDIKTEKGAEQLLKECNQLGPVGGIFNLAVDLRDAYMENQTAESFAAVAAPKILGTMNLDKASRNLCPQLDHFVGWSSVTSGRGFEGQVPYGLANSGLERICEVRHADGLPAIAMQYGALGDVGLLFEELGLSNTSLIGGVIPLRMAACVATFDILLQQPDAIVTSMVVADKERGGDRDTSKGAVQAIADILGIKDMKKVRPTQTLVDLGMDSITGTEVKNILEQDYDLFLNAGEIRKLTFNALHALTQEESA